ncbi:cytochrome-c peroxidase [Runella zeae]|uniref:cytochrome-c peroxidase n=1 Tax=Runella zeae TaxID=94255 RepID=UPI000401A298|nr:cytochrome c peroxidase [Runella zeae]
MKNTWLILFSLGLFGWASCSRSTDVPTPEPQPEQLEMPIPTYFPKMVYNLSSNPITYDGFQLGRSLFYDGILSRNGTIACGTCHQQAVAFTHHGHDLSHGIDDKIGMRNAPPIQNMAWEKTFFWDGGVHDLDLFPIAPIENPVEMDEKLPNVLQKLRDSKNPDYPQLFKKAFGTTEITTERFTKALSQFMVFLVSNNSRYDLYLRGTTNALTATEKEGLAIFRQKCGTCHEGELFTDQSFRNNGLSIARSTDEGRFRITQNPEDRYKFKVPSLRNVGYTSPYMHDGRFATLEQVLDHYAQNVKQTPNLDPLLQQNNQLGISLTSEEKQKIIAFLRTLSDEQFVKDYRFADPGFGKAF